jgi:hypothetical protein
MFRHDSFVEEIFSFNVYLENWRWPTFFIKMGVTLEIEKLAIGAAGKTAAK